MILSSVHKTPFFPASPCEANEKLITRLALGEDIPPRKMAQMHEHLHQCPTCQDRYNRVIFVTRLVNSGPEALDTLSPAELDLSWKQITARLQPEKAGSVWGGSWAKGMVMALTAASILIVMGLMVQKPSLTVHEDPMAQLQARGGGGGTSQEKKLSFRVFCLEGQTSRVEEKGTNGSCHLSQLLSFSYTNRSSLPYLFLFGLDNAYQVQWYAPVPPEKESLHIQTSVVDKPLQRTVRLQVNHQGGPLRIFALFSAEPLAAQMINEAAMLAKKRATPLAQLQRLPLPLSVEQRSVLLHLEEE